MAKKPRPLIRPGEIVPDSGIWRVPGRRSTLVEGEPAPPTPRKGQKWRQEIDTNPKD